MGGGLMQLVAYGAQDIYLTGNPQITFFKVVYRRYTNFAMEAIEQTFNGQVGYGNRVTSTISRNGDLIHQCWLECSALAHWRKKKETAATGRGKGGLRAIAANLGTALIDEISIEIGGQQIDKHYGHWMETWSELTESNSSGTTEMLRFASFPCNPQKVNGKDRTNDNSLFAANAPPSQVNNGHYDTIMKGFGTKFQVTSLSGGICGPVVKESNNGNDHQSEIQPWYLPLQFWFCKNAGLSLPLIALQYHEVKIVLCIQNYCQLSGNGALDPNCLNVNLWVDYIYLDTDERRRFAQVSHEYLIEQLQFQNANSGKNCIDLTFNHPVKEIIWIGAPKTDMNIQCELVEASDDYYEYFTNDYRQGGKHDDTQIMQHNAIVTGAYFQGPSTPTSVIVECPENLGSVGPKFLIKLNGHDRFCARDYRYFTRAQVQQYHTGYGGIELRSLFVENELLLASDNNFGFGPGAEDGSKGAGNLDGVNGYSGFDQVNLPTLGDTIAVYSFALKPEEHQPSGTCNFSRIDTAQLCLSCNGVVKNLYIYAVNYNVLRIMSGMGGLAYSN